MKSCLEAIIDQEACIYTPTMWELLSKKKMMGISLSFSVVLEGFNNLSDSGAVYTLKYFVVCFNLCLFTDYDKVIFP